MKTLVTGGNGFIGAHLVRQLLEEQREVRVLVHPADRGSNLEGLEVERVEGDLLDRAAVERAVRGVSRIFHLAAIYRIWLPDPGLIYRVNIDGSRNLLWAAHKQGVERVVYTSSIAALGVRPGKQAADETTTFNQWSHADAYVMSKYLSEQEALGFARNGLPLVVVNPCFPFGSHDTAPTPTGQILVNIIAGKAPGIPQGGFNAVPVDAVARGHILAEKHGQIGQRYILGGENLSYRRFFALIAELAGVKTPRWTLPYPLLLGLGSVAEWFAEHVTRREPIATRKTVEYTHNHLYYDISKARRELGYAPRPTRAALADAIAWFQRSRPG